MAKYAFTMFAVILLAGCSRFDFTDSSAPVPSPTVAVSAGTEAGSDTGTSDNASNDTAEPTEAQNTAPTSELTSEPTSTPTPTPEPTSTPTPTPEPTSTPTPTPTPKPVPVGYKGSLEIPADITDPMERMEYLRNQLIINTAYYDSLDNTADGTWCFKRMKDHVPSGTYENFRIADYNSCYLDDTVTDDDKVIYLTFDCGYPSDNTAKILDILAKHNAKANFFVTKMYLKDCSAYAKRMVEEGHAVCNHTVSHTDLTNKSVEKIAAEILDVAEYFYEITGHEFAPYFRTPTGAYTKRLLSIIRDAGYKTVFWSIAYGDYDNNNQPKPGYVTDHFATYHHNGAIALMHNDSSANVNELDAVLTLLEDAGYRFALLYELDQ
ncbi:MAG: polysaccharide deacetylase family protein [Lachnospiraceae bacterium]|nr:polysaccharide deacetylase family protein [Lachnospiraceae bacterium]